MKSNFKDDTGGGYSLTRVLMEALNFESLDNGGIYCKASGPVKCLNYSCNDGSSNMLSTLHPCLICSMSLFIFVLCFLMTSM